MCRSCLLRCFCRENYFFKFSWCTHHSIYQPRIDWLSTEIQSSCWFTGGWCVSVKYSLSVRFQWCLGWVSVIYKSSVSVPAVRSWSIVTHHLFTIYSRVQHMTTGTPVRLRSSLLSVNTPIWKISSPTTKSISSMICNWTDARQNWLYLS